MRLRTIHRLLLPLTCALFTPLACSDSDSSSSGGECAVGSERCSCTAGGSCDPGLECLSGKCVTEGGGNCSGNGNGNGSDNASSGNASGNGNGSGNASSGNGSGSGNASSNGNASGNGMTNANAGSGNGSGNGMTNANAGTNNSAGNGGTTNGGSANAGSVDGGNGSANASNGSNGTEDAGGEETGPEPGCAYSAASSATASLQEGLDEDAAASHSLAFWPSGALESVGNEDCILGEASGDNVPNGDCVDAYTCGECTVYLFNRDVEGTITWYFQGPPSGCGQFAGFYSIE